MIPALPHILFIPLIALITSFVVTALLKRSRAGLILDLPNRRSLHTTPTPRLGGIGVLAGFLAAAAYVAPAVDTRLALGLALLIVISLLDDVRGVSVRWRILVHLAAAGLAMSALIYPLYGVWAALVATLATAWMINLYNFMDGADGLAGGMTLFGFGTYGIAAWLSGDYAMAALNLAIAAAALGFLLFNFPPASVFMGDAGAVPLGYLAAVIGIAGWLRHDWPWWLGAVAFSPFIVDASCTLAKRLARGERVWEAHRGHYYQRLVQNGWGHRKTALAEYALMAICCGIALAGMQHNREAGLTVLMGMAALYIGLIAVAEYKLGRAPDAAA